MSSIQEEAVRAMLDLPYVFASATELAKFQIEAASSTGSSGEDDRELQSARSELAARARNRPLWL